MDMDLVKVWQDDKMKRFGKGKAAYVENRDQLLNVDPSKTDYLLGKLDTNFGYCTTALGIERIT